MFTPPNCSPNANEIRCAKTSRQASRMRIKIYWRMTQSIPDAHGSFECDRFLSIYPSNSADSDRWITVTPPLQICETFSLFLVTRGPELDKSLQAGEQSATGFHPGDEDNWPVSSLKWSLLMIQRGFINWNFSYKCPLESQQNAYENAAPNHSGPHLRLC